MRTALFFLVPLALATQVRADEPKLDAQGVDFFEKKIRPVLVEQCYKCHLPDAKKTNGGLALDTRAGLLEGGETGPAVVPGVPAKGTLLKALRHEGAVKMPNEDKKLPDAVLADFEAWVKMGAPDPRSGKSAAKRGIDYAAARDHWAYKAVTAPKPPAVRAAAWPANDTDRFVLAALEAKNLAPAPDAAKHAWLRRVTFDLTGLPPTPDEADAFAKDDAPNAHAKVVDRLLASPRFGEHWARHWMDGVRFDPAAQTIERYRDWLARALNADTPYDTFLTLQIAGDLLPPVADARQQADRVFATQMLALNLGEMDPVEGMVEVFGQQVLGVSINCAKCHDHKFDAYSQQDYYALAGVFASSVIAGTKGPKAGGVEVPGEAEKVLALVDAAKPADTNLLVRGEKAQKGPVVPRRFPVALAGDSQTPISKLTAQSGRLELAKWAASATNPLTARVYANRVWQRMFGAGIVRTPNDFGLAGDAPTNAALLDHLAHKFANEFGWSQKKLIREVALSRTYRQSAANPAARAADPENKLFARAAVRRLSYEQTIDALYSVSGVLTFDVPVRGKGNNQYPRFGSNNKDVQTVGYRALYHDDPFTRGLFDGADPDLITEGRAESVTAPQMLFLLNNPQVAALGAKVAGRVRAAGDTGAQVAAAYKLLYSRAPTAREIEVGTKFLKAQSLDRYCHALLATSEFAYVE